MLQIAQLHALLVCRQQGDNAENEEPSKPLKRLKKQVSQPLLLCLQFYYLLITTKAPVGSAVFGHCFRKTSTTYVDERCAHAPGRTRPQHSQTHSLQFDALQLESFVSARHSCIFNVVLQSYGKAFHSCTDAAAAIRA